MTSLSQSFGQSGFVGSSLSLNSGGNGNCPAASNATSTMTSSALISNMSNSPMYNEMQQHHQQQHHQQHQQPHSAYMSAQGFFQDRNEITENAVKGWYLPGVRAKRELYVFKHQFAENLPQDRFFQYCNHNFSSILITLAN